jgi:hypothetical protein
MTANLGEGAVVVKRSGGTRWSSNYYACHALATSYSEICQTLHKISDDQTEQQHARHEAQSLCKKFDHIETAIMGLVWKDITTQLHKASTSLQAPGISLAVAVNLYTSLTLYLGEMRHRFDEYEESAKQLVTTDHYRADIRRPRRQPKFADESGTPSLTFSGRDDLKVNTFYVIIDQVIAALTRRKSAYSQLQDKYNFLTNFKCMELPDIREKARNLQHHFNEDLEVNFPEEFQHFTHFVDSLSSSSNSSPHALQLLQLITTNHLESTFPNVEIALRIYLSLMCTNYKGERSFSTLSRVKNGLRSTMGQERLSVLSLLSIESDITRSISYDDVIRSFAAKKSRRRVHE